MCLQLSLIRLKDEGKHIFSQLYCNEASLENNPRHLWCFFQSFSSKELFGVNFLNLLESVNLFLNISDNR